MQANYLKCTFCLQNFNTTNRTPYILIECGHSICQKCLTVNIQKQTPFNCPEDHIEINTLNRKISDFPKNQALLNMINLQQEAASQDDNNTSEEENKPVSLKISKEDTSAWNSYKEKKHKRRMTMKTLPKRLDTKRSDSMSDDGGEDICVKHHKRLEVICTDPGCQIKVCYQCGLFGEHSVG